MKPFFDQILKNISEIFKSIIANAKKDNNYKLILILIFLAFFALLHFSLFIVLSFIDWSIDYLIFLYKEEKSPENFRNISLAILGMLVGLALAIWRSLIAEKQWKVSLKQAETSEKQWRTAEEGQQTDRYQKAAQMLASKNETERIGAIYALRDLVLANAEVYHITVMDLFCAFLRKPLLSDTERKKIEALKEELKQKDDAIKNEDINEQDKQSKLKKNRDVYIKKINEAYPSFPADRQLICEIAFATLRDFETYPDHQKIEKKWRPYLEKAELINLNAPTNAKLDKYNFANINARQADFSGANCTDADFSEAKCYDANFSGADCRIANFSGADCRKASFSGADCRKANFSGADCFNANFSGARCTEADFSGTNCRFSDFSGTNCSDVNFSGADCFNANFSRANCKGAVFSGAYCRKANFSRAYCREADFSWANCREANFSEADCCWANFSGANCMNTNFSGADCCWANFSGANCMNTNFSGADCYWANFSGAFIGSTDFSQSKNLNESQIENAFVFGDCSENDLPKIPDAWKRNARDIIHFLDPKLKDKFYMTNKIEREKFINYNAKKWHEWDENIRKSWLDGSWKKDKK